MPHGESRQVCKSQIHGTPAILWREIWLSRRGSWGVLTLACILAALACAPLTGCRDKSVGVVLTYTVQTPGNADAEAMKRAVVKVINLRLDGAGEARPLVGPEVEVDLFGEPTRAEVNDLQRLISAPGVLEFRIMPTPAAAKHKAIIELAQQLPADANVVHVEDRPVARWAEFSPKEFGDADQARSRGLIVRMAGETPQALVLVNDGINVTGKYLRSATVDVDETGRPQVRFAFNAEGAFKFGQITGSHVPNQSGVTFQLGILLDDRLLSAPTIQSKITDRGRISGGAMGAAEVKQIVAILNSGPLPCAIELISKKSTPAEAGD